MKPHQSVHEKPRTERGPQDLLRESPPPDANDGMTPDEAVRHLESDPKRERQSSLPAGVVPGERVPGNNKCGGRMGRCFGQVVVGKCQSCGLVYGPPAALGGSNGRF